MVRTYTKAVFDRVMKDINNIDDKVRDYLYDIGYERWFISHFNVDRSMVMTSNITKSLNSANREAKNPSTKKLLEFMMNYHVMK